MARILIALVLVSIASVARADTTPFVFDRAIYIDSQEGPLRAPEGVACSDSGALVVADTGNGRLVTYSYSAGTLSGGASVKLPQLAYPTRVAFDSKGNILALDQKSRKLVRLDPSGTFLGNVEVKGNSSFAGALPVSFKLDASDNIYVLDVAARKVLVADPAGVIGKQIELPPPPAIFTDIFVDPAGTIFAVDGIGAMVWAAEKGAPAFKPLTQSLKDRMNFPVYVTGARGRLYLVDQNGNGIVVLGIDGSYQGRQLAIGWNEGFVYYPTQICLNGAGEVYVADRSNNRVQVFKATK